MQRGKPFESTMIIKHNGFLQIFFLPGFRDVGRSCVKILPFRPNLFYMCKNERFSLFFIVCTQQTERRAIFAELLQMRIRNENMKHFSLRIEIIDVLLAGLLVSSITNCVKTFAVTHTPENHLKTIGRPVRRILIVFKTQRYFLLCKGGGFFL